MVEWTRLFEQKEAEWPVNKEQMDHLLATTEVKKSKSELPNQSSERDGERSMITIKQERQPWRLSPERYLSWKRFTRVLAWVCRFVENCRVRKKENLSQPKSKFKQLGMPSKKPSVKNIWPFDAKKNYHRTVKYLLYDHDWTRRV